MTDAEPKVVSGAAYAAATLTYVRTPDGVVEVTEGDKLPDAVYDAHLQALIGADAVAKVKATRGSSKS